MQNAKKDSLERTNSGLDQGSSAEGPSSWCSHDSIKSLYCLGFFNPKSTLTDLFRFFGAES